MRVIHYRKSKKCEYAELTASLHVSLRLWVLVALRRCLQSYIYAPFFLFFLSSFFPLPLMKREAKGMYRQQVYQLERPNARTLGNCAVPYPDNY